MVFSSFSALVLTTYHLEPMVNAACTNLFKNIVMTPTIKSFLQTMMYPPIISFLFHSFLSSIFKFTQPQVRIATTKLLRDKHTMVKHDHFLFSPVIAQKIECTCKIAPNKETQFLESSLEDEILPYIATG